jgi:pyruvate/2-oxoglutarate/acetoin dehydrogenase E1 component
MRISQNLNQALSDLLADDPDLYLLGEDIADPYGGAFKVTRGLTTRFPDRVLTTPLSEGSLVGIAAGLALGGQRAIVEMMFGDFVALAFDQIVNFASKSVSMYGRRVSMPVVVRCPVGGGRGYGPTHSQSLQKHFVGVPGLSLYEMSPFHDNGPLLREVLTRGEPAIFFEDKALYGRHLFTNGVVDKLFSYDLAMPGIARVFAEQADTADCVLIAPGGVVHKAIKAAQSLLLEKEISVVLVVPSRLYPFDVEPLVPMLRRAELVCIAEESTAGGTWGSEIAQQIYQELWNDLRRPIVLVNSEHSVIPTSKHLEDQVLIQDITIREAIAEAFHD